MTSLSLPRPPAWMEDAACASVGGDAWFPTKGGTDRSSARAAQQICASCPVAAECLSFGIEHGDGYGIWGGVKPKQRRGMAA